MRKMTISEVRFKGHGGKTFYIARREYVVVNGKPEKVALEFVAASRTGGRDHAKFSVLVPAPYFALIDKQGDGYVAFVVRCAHEVLGMVDDDGVDTPEQKAAYDDVENEVIWAIKLLTDELTQK